MKCFFTGPMGRQKNSVACSPPYKRVRALRLFDSPATPRTLVARSTMHTPIPNKGTRLFHADKPKAVPTAYHHQHQVIHNLKNNDAKPHANINPFTPNGMLLTARKRTRSKRSLIGWVLHTCLFVFSFVFGLVLETQLLLFWSGKDFFFWRMLSCLQRSLFQNG